MQSAKRGSLVRMGHNAVKCEKPIAKRCGKYKSDGDCDEYLTCTGATKTRPGSCSEIVEMWGECSNKCSRCRGDLTCKHGICLAPVFNY